MRRMADHASPRWATLRHAVILLLATAASVIAKDMDRPVTAALVYVLGVLVIGADGGIRPGIASALVASFIYNFFIRFPAFSFGYSSIDDFLPVVAFNVVAVVSGVLSGRLRDRANAAEIANHELDRLLRLSRALQGAHTYRDVADALVEVLDGPANACHVLRNVAGQDFAHREQWDAVLDDLAKAAAAHPSTSVPKLDVDAIAGLAVLALERCDALDIRTEAAAIRRSEELKAAVLSSFSHDLRTPLAVISASASSLLEFGEALATGTRTQLLTTIQSQCQRLDRYTQKAVGFGRLYNGLSGVVLEHVDVCDVLGSAIATIRERAPDAYVEKNFIAGVFVMADEAMLQQVFVNILENGVAYSGDQPQLNVYVERIGGRVAVHFADSGIGILEADLDRIFDRFYRGERTEKRPGLGLGLSIARGFVEAFGGTIEAISPGRSGDGSEIIVYLRACESTAFDEQLLAR